jgi:hypothetical protein
VSESALLTAPVEIVDLPGKEEAAAIRTDYLIVTTGVHAFVRMGFRLIDVKSRLPHGAFLAWCGEHLNDLSPRRLQSAKSTVDELLKVTGIKYEPRFAFESPPEIHAIVEGKDSIRALLGAVREFRQDEAEAEAKRKCYEEFAKDPSLQDEWEPRVLSGELDWCQARRGITGRLATLGNKRADPDYAVLIPRVITTLKNGFTKWDAIPEDKQECMVSSLRDLLTSMPSSVRQALGLNKS